MKTILHVEDDPLIVHIYGTALVRAGFKVEVAEDGIVAAKMLNKSRPDLVVLDLMIPKLTGKDVMKFIRSTPALQTLPVVILSSASIADEGIEAAALGVEGVLYKAQCTPAILIATINNLLGDASDPSAQLPSA
jgi:DNA-binding response OmpR family regulator